MSEKGWQEFLAAEDVEPWVVLRGGATTVVRTESFAAAAGLAEAIVQITSLEGSGTLLTIADKRLTVRLTRDHWQLERL